MKEKLESYLQQNIERYLDLLKQMVAINSFTDNAEGVNNLGDLTAKVFDGLGFQDEAVPSIVTHYGKHRILSRKGTGEHTIALISHLDTVFSEEEERKNQFVWRREGDRIYGPGTVDIKGGTIGIYMLLEALQAFDKEAFEKITWLIFMDASEETLSADFGKLCCERLDTEKTLACLVFEGGFVEETVFNLVVARKGRVTLKISIEGKSAHAGSTHALGANAILQAARIVEKVQAKTNYEKEVTINVGAIKGGTTFNRVPHQAELQLEMRAFDPVIYNEVREQLLALAGQGDVSSFDGNFTCNITVEILSECPPWNRTEATNKLLANWREVAHQHGWQINAEERGGLSDANYIGADYPTLDGLGPFGDNAHCSEHDPDSGKEQEYLAVNSLVPKTALNFLAIQNLIKKQ